MLHTPWGISRAEDPDSARVDSTSGSLLYGAIGRPDLLGPELDEQTYVRELLDGLGAYPAYYAHMSPLHAAGPSEPDLRPPPRRRRRRAALAHRGRRVGRGPAPPHRVR